MELHTLVDNLRQENLVAFLGAGVSRMYTDPNTKRMYPGLPTASEIVATMAERYPEIDGDLSFIEACFLYKKKYSRGALEIFLLEQIDRPVIKPLPAHVILANLSFAAFITTNYDDLLERSLRESMRRPHAIVVDEDVSRLRTINTPILKIHGCISRPETMIAAEDEYRPLGDVHPIIEALLRTQLANRILVFLGYSLDDHDFRMAYDRVKSTLGDYMPRSYAIVHKATSYRKQYWQSCGVTLIEEDLTDFLRALLRAAAEIDYPTVYTPGEDWINNAFFESLHNIQTLPSETQVVDAYLAHLLKELQSPGFSLDDVITRAKKAAALVLLRRVNLHALRSVSDFILTSLKEDCKSKNDAELIVKRTLNERQALGHSIASKAPIVVSRGDNILIFSQSVRVTELLCAVPAGVQDTCHIYVAECRAKSPDPFQDALAFCTSLHNTGYEFTIVPDVAVGNLIGRKQLHKVLLGAHSIFRVDDKPIAFVNTCGSQTILLVAADANIPVYIIAETMKVMDVSSEDDMVQHVSFDQEEDLSHCISARLSDLNASGQHVSTLNIGYDLCQIGKNVHLITEI